MKKSAEFLGTRFRKFVEQICGQPLLFAVSEFVHAKVRVVFVPQKGYMLMKFKRLLTDIKKMQYLIFD